MYSDASCNSPAAASLPVSVLLFNVLECENDNRLPNSRVRFLSRFKSKAGVFFHCKEHKAAQQAKCRPASEWLTI